MAQRNPTLRTVGLIIFFIAISVGIILTLLRAVPDLEASMYGFIKYGYPRLYTLSCPVFMTKLDREAVSIRLHNSLARDLSYYVETQLSAPFLIITDDQRLSLSPGESKRLTWEVAKENIDLGNFIFARVFTSAAMPNGFHEATCGTFVLGLPFKGGPQLFYALLLLSVVGMALGLGLWFRTRDLADPTARVRTGWMISISLVVLIGIVTSLFDIWFAALLMVFLTLLLVLVYLSRSTHDVSFQPGT